MEDELLVCGKNNCVGFISEENVIEPISIKKPKIKFFANERIELIWSPEKHQDYSPLWLKENVWNFVLSLFVFKKTKGFWFPKPIIYLIIKNILEN